MPYSSLYHFVAPRHITVYFHNFFPQKKMSGQHVIVLDRAYAFFFVNEGVSSIPDNGVYQTCLENLMRSNHLTHWGRDKWPPFSRRHFQMHFLQWKYMNFAEISLRFVPNGPINNIPALVQIMAWHRPDDKPLSEPVLVGLLTHIWVTRPQWVKVTQNSRMSMALIWICRLIGQAWQRNWYGNS